MSEIIVEQNSAEWLQLRCGSIGASAISDAIAKTKSGWGASRKNLIARLVAEQMANTPTESFSNAAMQWGHDQEPFARAEFEMQTGLLVRECGLFKHPKIENTHSSPDGMIGEGTAVEIKCPNTATHIDYLLSGVPKKYIPQMQWHMACTGAIQCYFISYDPRMPEHLQLFYDLIDIDPEFIAETEGVIIELLQEVDSIICKLNKIEKK